jgi:hypothetical protein
MKTEDQNKPDAYDIRVAHARSHLEAIVADAALIPMAVLRPRITRVEVSCIQSILDELHRLNLVVAYQTTIVAARKAKATARTPAIAKASAPTPPPLAPFDTKARKHKGRK